VTSISEKAGEALDGMRIDRVVALLADVSRAAAARLITQGNVRVDGSAVNSVSRRVRRGESLHLEVESGAGGTGPVASSDVAFKTVFADDDVVVCCHVAPCIPMRPVSWPEDTPGSALAGPSDNVTLSTRTQ